MYYRLFFFISLVSFALSASAPTRVIKQTSKTLYTSRLLDLYSNFLQNLFPKGVSFKQFELVNGTTTARFINQIDYVYTPDVTDIVPSLNNDCSAVFDSTKEQKISFSDLDVNYEVSGNAPVLSKASFDLYVSKIHLERKNSVDKVGSFEYSLNEVALRIDNIFSSSNDLKSFLEANVAELLKKFDTTPFIDASLTTLNSLTNSQSIPLNSNTIKADSTEIKLEYSTVTSCNDDKIIENFSGKIIQDYTSVASDFKDFKTDSEDQIFIDRTFIDELLTYENPNFNWVYNKANDSTKITYNYIGFLVDRLSLIFPDVFRVLPSGTEYQISCHDSNFKANFQTAKPLILTLDFVCDILSFDGSKTYETISPLILANLNRKIDGNDYVFSINSLKLKDFTIKSSRLFNISLLEKEITYMFETYLKEYIGNEIEFFRIKGIDANTKYEFTDSKGLLRYQAKPAKENFLE